MNISRLTLIQSVATALLLLSLSINAQSLSEVTSEECVRGDCTDGGGRLELATPWGKGGYLGHFREGEFDGFGRLEVPISFTEKTLYVGNWERGVRTGRGAFWNGRGKLYIGQWRNDKRHGQGSYFFNLAEWQENEHSEYWLKENTENYSGDFFEDFYQGQGIYRWPGGQKYVGGFFANDKHGPGTYYYVTGTERKQLWDYGDFVR